MKRDFSTQAKEELLAAIADAEDDIEGWWIFNDIADWVGDQFISGDINSYGGDISRYHTAIVDKKNTTVSQLNTIWENVYGQDALYSREMDELLSGDGEVVRNALAGLAMAISPNPPDGLPMLERPPTEVNKFFEEVFAGIDDIRAKKDTFDDVGQFGGDQGNPQTHPRDFDDIIHRYFPDMTKKEVDAFLEEMNSVGCGYVAMSHSIFEQFIGREEEFERIFGFPMYVDGDFNYDAMLVDFYSSVGNLGEGTRSTSREQFWEKYLERYDVEVDVRQINNMTLQDFERYASQGQVVVGVSPVELQNEAGEIDFTSDGGHAMTVTGITDDGRYIVSSWGKVYYLDPSTGTGWLDFEVIDYE
ncbi:MAG: hypothetical protein LBS58_00110 [Coriobacteriales bacterium]|nr:hypothetical protein [Coriobacteriales bacterium]